MSRGTASGKMYPADSCISIYTYKRKAPKEKTSLGAFSLLSCINKNRTDGGNVQEIEEKIRFYDYFQYCKVYKTITTKDSQ